MRANRLAATEVSGLFPPRRRPVRRTLRKPRCLAEDPIDRLGWSQTLDLGTTVATYSVGRSITGMPLADFLE